MAVLLPHAWAALFLDVLFWITLITASPEEVIYKDTGMDNKVFSNQVLFVTLAKDEADCARLCSLQEICFTFTFTDNSAQCQGHFEFMTSTGEHSEVKGAKSYSLQRARGDKTLCRTHGLQQLSVPSLKLNIPVFCDGDWLVILRRRDGSVDFYRNWKEYQQGFGDLQGEFWIGLETVHRLTWNQTYDLTIDLGDWQDIVVPVFYTNFSLSPAHDGYRLHLNFVASPVNESMAPLSGSKFTTYDADNDNFKHNCAVKFHGAWWYTQCSGSSLMGLYSNVTHCQAKNCVLWKGWRGMDYSLKFAQMRIRPSVISAATATATTNRPTTTTTTTTTT